MSKLAIRVYYTDVDGMPHNAKMVLMALAEHHNIRTGLAWPSAATMAKHMKMSRRSALRGLVWLKAHGYIKVAVPNRTGRDAVRYRIMEDMLAPIPGSTGDTESLVTRSHQLVTRRRQTSDTVAQEPEREPVQEPASASAPAETLAAEQEVTWGALLQRCVACGTLTREEAEALCGHPDKSLAVALEDSINVVDAAVGNGK
jgi:predicted ArsR family transcriptional regulator